MRVAALQFEPRFLDPDRNLGLILRHLAAAEADLVVLPELCLSGYLFSHPSHVARAAEAPAGERISAVAAIARQKSMAVVLGFVEREGARFYNSAAFVTGAGAQTIYRKTHLYGAEKKWFAPGDSGFLVTEWKGARIGMMICYDWRFPEAARSLALQGADIICHPSDLVTPAEVWGLVLRARAIENKVYIVTADRTGTETNGEERVAFTGCSRIISYNGTVLAQADAASEILIGADIEPQEARAKSFSEWNDILADRRPDFYLP